MRFPYKNNLSLKLQQYVGQIILLISTQKMEILIPVTKVFKSKKFVGQTQPQMDEGMQRQRAKTQKPLQLIIRTENLHLSNKKNRGKSNRVHMKNQDQGTNSYQNAIHTRQKSNEEYFDSKVPRFQRLQEKADCQMQKKSTQSSLHEIQRLQNLELQHPDQASSANIFVSKGETHFKEKEEFIKFNFQLRKDEFNNEDLQKSCKICLGEENQSEIQSNPLARVCKCQDYVHVICLQQWINHRDLLNGSSALNQCQVCRQSYNFKLYTESFLSLEVFMKKMGSKPTMIALKFLLVLILFVFSAFGIYLFIELLTQGSQHGGYVRQALKVPYGTCLVIIMLISVVGVLVFIILAHNFVTSFCLHFKYKIGKITQQNSKCYSRNLNNIGSDAR